MQSAVCSVPEHARIENLDFPERSDKCVRNTLKISMDIPDDGIFVSVS